MAKKRMFSLGVLETDAFMDMPLSAQALYFHLNLRADDDGFVGNPKRITQSIGANIDDLKLLVAKRFVIAFEDGVIVIKHWRMHNVIKKDRYTETNFTEDLRMLDIKENGAYTLKGAAQLECGRSTNGAQMERKWSANGEQMSQTCSTDKISIDKVSIDKDSIDNIYVHPDERFEAVEGEIVVVEDGKNASKSTSKKTSKKTSNDEQKKTAYISADERRRFEAEFVDVWERYPKKQGKANAMESYIKARHNGTMMEEVIDGIERYINYIIAEHQEKYIKMGSSWFNQKGWEDEYKITRNLTTKDLAKKMDFSDFM